MPDTHRPRRWGPCVLALLLTAAVLPVVLSGSPVGASPATAGAGGLFTPLPDFRLGGGDDVRVRPRAFAAYDVDAVALDRRLETAPSGRAARRGADPLRVRLPDPDGELVSFDVVEDSILEPALAARHPEIRTFAGRAVGGTSTVRLDLTPMGLHASVRSPGAGRGWFIDPARNARGTTQHLSYYRADLPRSTFVEEELAGLDHVAEDTPTAATAAEAAAAVAPDGPVALRTYRLAFATDPAYAAYFGTANVFAEKVTLMNRVNQIYLDDLAIRMVLVDGTDTLLNFDTMAEAAGPDGPCGIDPCYDAADLTPGTGGCSSALLTSNEFALAQTIGADRYDIGHIGLGINGGGIAGLGVVGESGKADGCTGLATPEGDFYAIDYVAHEMGHQFAGNHTFNGSQRNCSLTNRNGPTAVEPGSGSSVMGYAGICGQDDLQPHTDPYFSQRSLDEITAHVTAEPTSYAESQTVTLRGFDTDGESVTLSYPGRDDVTIVRGPASYSVLNVAAQMQALTGELVSVGGYHAGPLMLNDGGFSVSFPPGAGDVARIGVASTTGDVEAFLGVETNGGLGTNQGVATATANHAPRVVAPADRTIPLRTPFSLTGAGTDVDGDPLVYLWEQNDAGSALPIGGTALTSNGRYDGPLFRVFGTRADVTAEAALDYGSAGENLAGSSPSRTFPDLDQVLAGTTNAVTGTCPAGPADPEARVPAAVVDCYSEFLPTADYLAGSLTFRLTARDLATGGGGVQHDDTVLTLDGSAGPFLVTSRATAGGPAVAGRTEEVTWAVNGTDAAALAPRVRISLSTDGGRSFPHVLLASTPNDGSAAVVWPYLDTSAARVKVEAVGNYFFDVNDAPVVLTDAVPPATRLAAGPANGDFVLGRTVVRLASDKPGVTYSCRLDGAALPCGSRVVLRGLREGQHTFTAAARDRAGRVDASPLVRRFAVPRDDRRLTRTTPGWRRIRSGPAFRDTLLVSTRPDQALTTRVTRARSLALVAPRAPGYGGVRVLAGGRTIAIVDLSSGRRRSAVVIALKRFAKPFTGRVRIETLGPRPVRIDGLGVYRG